MPGRVGEVRVPADEPEAVDLTRQTRFGLWAGCGQAHAPGACPTVPSELAARQSHWKPSSGFGEAAPARLTVDLPDYR